MTDASRMSGPSADSGLPESEAATDSPSGEKEPPPAERKTRSGLRSLFFGRSDDSAKADRTDDGASTAPASAEPEAPGWGAASAPRPSAAAELAGSAAGEKAQRGLRPVQSVPRDPYAALRDIGEDEETPDGPAAGSGGLSGPLGLRDLDRTERGSDPKSGFDPLSDPPDFEFRGFDLPEDPPASPRGTEPTPLRSVDKPRAAEPAAPAPKPRPTARTPLDDDLPEHDETPQRGEADNDFTGQGDRTDHDDFFRRRETGRSSTFDRDSDFGGSGSSSFDSGSGRSSRFDRDSGGGSSDDFAGRSGSYDRDGGVEQNTGYERGADSYSGYASDDSGEHDFNTYGSEQPTSPPYGGTGSQPAESDSRYDRDYDPPRRLDAGANRGPFDEPDEPGQYSEYSAPQQRQSSSGYGATQTAGYGLGSIYTAKPTGAQATDPAIPTDPAAREAWWAKDAQADPWRDPDSAPAWMAPPLPAPPSPRLPIRLAPPRQATGKGMGQIVAVAVFAALLAGLLGGAFGYVIAANTVGPAFSLGSSAEGTPTLAKRPPGSIAGIAQRIQPSVVTIDIRSATGAGNGSGFIISKNGHILTNNHVAEPADTAGGSLTVVFHDGTTAAARIIGRDPGSDVAVLKVEKNNLPAVQFADSDKASVGDPVIAFGSPLGLNGTVTTGIISAMERPVKTGGREGGEEAYMAAIQTDAAINPGNSGGPLVDGDGRVIGIDSAIATIPGETGKVGSIGLGFAIPMNQAKRTAEQLIANGKATTTVIGADLDRTSKLATGGVRVTEVPDGPAKQAGLRAGDVIIRLNNRVIGDAVDLIALVRKLPPGTKASLVYTRGGRPATTSITLGAKTVN